ncbi:MAG: hypothetical protein NVS4B3_04340 [Gemmatimonadaceae bacterium]
MSLLVGHAKVTGKEVSHASKGTRRPWRREGAGLHEDGTALNKRRRTHVVQDAQREMLRVGVDPRNRLV